MTSVGTKRPREEDSKNPDVSRPRKRPGGAARISRVEADAVLQRQQQRAEEARQAAQTRGNDEVVRQHYNAVPQRGREWRKTDSRIKGLRSFNNWVKSTIIHKFSRSDSDEYPLRVLDIGCGKGGDLGKWQQAPQAVELYVGIDPAEISIDQARERYVQMRSGGGRGGRGGRGGHHGGRPQRTFDAEFFAEDAFTYSLGDIPIIREVGFGPGSRWGPGGGFDVVSMMFCMHYAFQTEAKAKGMLANVANSLKKGGRFLGVIPNSDVIRAGVEAFHKQQAKAAPPTVSPKATADKAKKQGIHEELLNGTQSPKQKAAASDSTPKKRKAADPPNDEPATKQLKSDAPPHSISDPAAALNIITEPPTTTPPPQPNGVSPTLNLPSPTYQPSTKPPPTPSPQLKDTKPDPPDTSTPIAEWGNSIYRIRFPGPTPADGVFRPPYGWKYSFFMEEAVEEVPEYVVPWEAFRGIAEDYNLELQYRKPFAEVWSEEKNHPVFSQLSERMGVRGRDGGPLLVSEEEMEAASESFSPSTF
ncbi:mRNA cap guanine-N7 methyltransferase [Lecanora helva]